MVYQTRELSRRGAREGWRKKGKLKKRGVNRAVYTQTYIHATERGKLVENRVHMFCTLLAFHSAYLATKL